MNKKLIIWSLALLFLIVLTEYAYAAACTVTDNNVTGSKTVTTNVIRSRNARINVYLYWQCTTNLATVGGRTFIQYGANTSSGDNTNTGANITTHCNGRAFKIVNLTGNNTNSCSTGQTPAHGCFRDSFRRTGGNNSWINFSIEDSAATATRERFTFGIRSCNVSGSFDIAAGGIPVTEGNAPTITFNNWFNLTIASPLFQHPDPANASGSAYFINTSSPTLGQTVNISTRFIQLEDIEGYMFSSNITGTWSNFSKVRVSGSAVTNRVNWTLLDMNRSDTKTVAWAYFVNDSSRLYNRSAINSVKPVQAPTDSCTPPGSGDWVITDTCYKSNQNINLAAGGRVLILGSGLLICDRTNITAAGSTPIMIILGQSLTKLVTKGASNC